MFRLAKTLLVVALFASPVVLHVATARHWPLYLSAALISVQLAVMLSIILTGWTSPWKFAAVIGVSASALALAWQFGAAGLTVSTGVPHAAANSALLAFFACSLRSGAEPVITRIIRTLRGPIPDELVVYGRTVTRIWCAFFAANLLISAALLSCAPLEIWSFFVNVINLPSIAAMFAAELLYRMVRFRHLPRSRICDMVKVVSAFRGGVGGAGAASPIES